MKMTITTTQEVATEVEIALPHYRKTSYGALYKISSEEDIIKIYNNEFGCSIDFSKHWRSVAFNSDTTECSYVEFNTAYLEIMTKLNNIKEEIIQDTFNKF